MGGEDACWQRGGHMVMMVMDCWFVLELTVCIGSGQIWCTEMEVRSYYGNLSETLPYSIHT